MLSVMRRNAGSWIIKIVLAVIVIVFAFWGVGSYGEMRRNRVATVGDHTITLLEFDASLRSLVQQAQNAYGEAFNETVLRSLKLEQQALNQLIERQVLLQNARSLKIIVSDEELRDSIYNTSVFQNESGEFDSNRYFAVLSNMRITNEAFEEMQRNDLVLNKLMQLVMGGVKVSNAEVMEWYQQLNRRVSAKYVEFDPAGYNVSVSEDEVVAYYEANRAQYMTRPMRQIAYAVFSPAGYMDRLDVTGDEIRSLYDNNIDLYSTPDLLDLSQIVIRISEPGNQGAEEAAKARADEAYAKLGQGVAFSDVVREYSEIMFQENDGKAADVPKSAVETYFGAELANTPAGELAPPVKTDYAWYIFRVDAVKPASQQAFEDVKDAIKADYMLNLARNMAYDDAEAVSAAVFGGEELEAAADAKGVTAVTTNYFDRGMLVSSLNLSQRAAFTDFVFEYEMGDVSEPREFEGDYYVAVILDEKAPEQIPLDGVRVVAEHAVRVEKQEALALADAQKMIEAVKGGKTIEEAAKSYKVTIKSTGLITRYNYDLDFATPGSPAQTALFALSESNPVIDQPLPGPMVLVYEDSAPAETDDYETEAAGIRMELLQEKREQVFAKYLQDLKQKTKIEISKVFMENYGHLLN